MSTLQTTFLKHPDAAGNQITFTSGGSTGIGTASPGNQNSATQLVVGNTSSNNGITILTGASNDGVLNFNDGDNASLRGFLIYEHSTDSLRFGTAASDSGRFDSSGRLLVGTSSSRGGFFGGSSGFDTLFQIEQSGYATASIVRNSNNTAAPSFILGKSRGTANGATTIVSSGDVVGEISFQAADGAKLVPAASIEAEVDGTPGTNDMPGRLVFATTADGASSPTEHARLQSNGTFKTSTSTGLSTRYSGNTYHLNHNHNNGNTVSIFEHTGATSPYGIYIQFSQASPDNNTQYFISAEDASAHRFYVWSDGDVVNHDNSYGAISDVKLKQDIVDSGSQWNDLKNLRVRKFKFKSDVEAYGDEAKTLIGLVAQEAELVSPGLVRESPDTDGDNNDLGTTTKSVNYSVLYMKAVKALQEAMDRIETLEAKVAALEAS